MSNPIAAKIYLRQTLGRRPDKFNSLAWSPDCHLLTSGAFDSTIKLWNAETGEIKQTLKGHTMPVLSVAWSPDGRSLASGGYDKIIRLWDAATGRPWVWDAETGMQRLWDAETGRDAETGMPWVWNEQARLLWLWQAETTDDEEKGKQHQALKGHTDWVRIITWSPNGRVLASGSDDGSVRVWRCDTWETATVFIFDRPPSRYFTFGLSFHPSVPALTMLGDEDDEDAVIRYWELDTDALVRAAPPVDWVHYASAKIVLVGEKQAGKSSLALRIAKDLYEEQKTTHGMRIWSVPPERLSRGVAAPSGTGEKRQVALWDMGGQDEYRLVHQLFFHDTTLALIFLDLTKGRAALDDVREWSLRLEKQSLRRKAIKLLVGSKRDEAKALIDQTEIKKLVEAYGFAGYYETSAKTSEGVSDLLTAISAAIDWEALAKTSRPVLYQHICDEIEQRRKAGEVILPYTELEEQIQRKAPDQFDPEALNFVVEQLALQGMISSIRLDSKELVLVLQVSEVERYAGSLIYAARNNPRGVPAIEKQVIASARMAFPGIKHEERLELDQERIVLECVVQLLLTQGVCLEHEGLLIFPALFQAAKMTDDGSLPYPVALSYDFSGAIDNIYSSLVVQLAISERFGRVGLWDNRAEFKHLEQGVCEVRKVERRSGFARLALFFSEQTFDETRDLFTAFVEDHLRKEGVSITTVLEVTCVCGYRFQESSLRKRLDDGDSDIICPECETRNRIGEWAKPERLDNLEVETNLVALKIAIDKKNKEAVVMTRLVFKEVRQSEPREELIHILHLSDLHMSSEVDLIPILQPLIRDLEDKQEGLGLNRLDYLVVSGDLTNHATVEEFEQARQFISRLISQFKLTAERCIIVPGNHDLSWDQNVYKWVSKNRVDLMGLKKGSYYEESKVVLIRDEDNYHARFENFANFYHSLIQQEYPSRAEEQCVPFLFADTMIQFLAMNSAWETDQFFPVRSSINDGAIARGLIEASEQIMQAKSDQRLPEDASILRIAVWHHPVTGNEKIVNDAFLERLRQENVQLCLHGHVHEERTDVIGYLHPTRKIHIAGAGSFGAPAEARPESVPRLYNLLEVAPDRRRIRVHTRSLKKAGGAWDGWAVWPGRSRGERRTYYDIKIPVRVSPKAPQHKTPRSGSAPPKGSTPASGSTPQSRTATSKPRKATTGRPRKSALPAFDVFLCHNSADKSAVKRIAEKLKEYGLRPWLGEWELRPGLPWLQRLEQEIASIKSAAVFVGKSGIGPWQKVELNGLLHEFVNRECPVIPVLLFSALNEPDLPVFLRGMTWVDFRKQSPDPMEQLIWGITGKKL